MMPRYLRWENWTGKARLIAADFEGWRDASRLRRIMPELRSFAQLRHQYESELKTSYSEYVSLVSDPVFAASLELLTFTNFLLDLYRPGNILDVGSGYSSYVFRRWKTQSLPTARVVSVDHDPLWLERTSGYLERNGLGRDFLFSWSAFMAHEWSPFDLIFHDIGGGVANRRATLHELLALLAPGGMLVLDDVQKRAYGAYARSTAKAAGCDSYSLRLFTKDTYGRFARLVIGGLARSGSRDREST
jgi:predicted O-methyltransferase YrrM